MKSNGHWNKGISVALLFIVAQSTMPLIMSYGDSMKPSMEGGVVSAGYVDIQEELRVNKELPVEKGDVVGFMTSEVNNGGMVIHRVIQIDEEERCMVTRGDNRVVDDGCIPFEDVWFLVREDELSIMEVEKINEFLRG